MASVTKFRNDMKLELEGLANELLRAEQDVRYWRGAFEQEHSLHTATTAELKLAKMAEGDAFLRGIFCTATTAFIIIGIVCLVIKL